jgi:hypothetical protein
MKIEMPMHRELNSFIDQYGMCGVLEILSFIAGERAEQKPELKRKYEKAQIKLWQLNQSKFMRSI